MNRETKNKAIRDSLSQTYTKRKTQKCLTFRFKVSRKSLTPEQKTELEMKLVEAKWIYNYILGEKLNPFDLTYKDIVDIYHLDRDRNKVNVTITHLKSSERDGLLEEMRNSMTSMSRLKSKGYTVGTLKFKSEYNSLHYKQYGLTHKIVGQKIKIQGIKKPIRVRGLSQIKGYDDIDLTTAKLLYDGYDYYITLTCYINKKYNDNHTPTPGGVVGLDFGCSDTVTLSDGRKLDVVIEETERLKKLQGKLSGQVKGSNNYRKTVSLIRKEYTHMSNIKREMTGKIIHSLFSSYDTVVTQDDDFNGWKNTRGKNRKIHHSILGRLKSGLKRHDGTVLLEKWFPTSRYCFNCGTVHPTLTEGDRTFICPVCGHTEDRDIHAAGNMVRYYEFIKDTPGTGDTSKPVKRILYKEFVAKQEAAMPLGSL